METLPSLKITVSYSLEEFRSAFKKTHFDVVVIQEQHAHPLLYEICFNGHTKVMIYSDQKIQSNSLIYTQKPYTPSSFFLKLQDLFPELQTPSIQAQKAIKN
jgi:hypothetical protein